MFNFILFMISYIKQEIVPDTTPPIFNSHSNPGWKNQEQTVEFKRISQIAPTVPNRIANPYQNQSRTSTRQILKLEPQHPKFNHDGELQSRDYQHLELLSPYEKTEIGGYSELYFTGFLGLRKAEQLGSNPSLDTYNYGKLYSKYSYILSMILELMKEDATSNWKFIYL